MAISRAQLAKELEPGLNALFGLEYARYDNESAEIYETELQRDDFKKIWEFVDVKEGHPEQESRWWRFFTLKK